MMNSPFETRLANLLAWATVCALAFAGKILAADFPQAEISNGLIRVKLYLPDAKDGYYRGTRFDWSGVIASLEYKGHNFYGPWFDGVDPKVHDYAYVGTEVVAGPCTAISGPAEEFQTNRTALGWQEAKAGETFIKIGVGVLRKDAGNYDFVKLYEIVNAGKWTVMQRPDSVEFIQELTDPSSGYAYIYRKIVRLVEGKPEMVLEHSLKNTGRRAIQSSVYNHNFLVLDNQPPGPDFSISVPFQIHSPWPPKKDLAQIQENHIVYSKVLENQVVVQIPMQGFGPTSKDYDIRIENRKVGAGMRIRGDRPLSFENFWSMRRVLAMEPFIAMSIDPGSEFTWNTVYEYYTLPSARNP
jgi:hypothetical protein